MKKSLNFLATILIPLALFFGVNLLLSQANISFAEETETETIVEEEYSQLYVNELSQFTKDSATLDPKTGNISSVPSYGRFGYLNVPENFEITTYINFSTKGNTTFIFRATSSDGNVYPLGNAGWTNRGYQIRLYGNARYDFLKGSTKVFDAKWPSHSGFTTGTDHKITIKAVDLSDGSVKISLTVDNKLFFEHIDDTDKISGNTFAICSEGSVFSAKGRSYSDTGFALSDVSSPSTSSNFTATINDDKSVSTSEDANALGASGAAYTFQASDLYTFKTKVKPLAEKGNFTFTLGSYKTNDRPMNRPNVIDEGWGWQESGYILSWTQNGKITISRGQDTTLTSFASGISYSANTEYEIMFGATQIIDGYNRIFFYVNGTQAANYIDGKTESYSPLSMRTIGGLPSSIYTTSLVMSYNVDAEILPFSATEYNTKTLRTADLGSPFSNTDTIFDRNGTPSSFNGGIIASYSPNIQSGSVKFNAKFTEIESSSQSNLILSLRNQGSYDTPWGNGWTNKGYRIAIYANGQVILYKNNTKLCEGWALNVKSLQPNTSYTIEFKTVDIATGIVLVQARINNSLLVNYVDSENALNNQGGLLMFSDGLSGSFSMFGVEKPTVITNAADNIARVGKATTLNYTSTDASQDDEVIYYIDEKLSTASASLNENILTPSSIGSIVLYARVNGVYSDNITLSVEESLKATITNLPQSPLIVGGETYTFQAALSEGEIETIEFAVENLSGAATINAQTGELTPVRAGQVNVYVTINDTQSQKYLISISPKIEIKNATALALGEVRSLDYEANCTLPDEDIITTYELVSGSDYAQLDSTTGLITAKNLGIITLRVTVQGTTFQAVSPIVQLAIEAPVVVLLNVQDMYVGQTISLNPKINDGVSVESEKIIITSGSSHIKLEGNNITALSEGTVHLKANVNGYESTILSFEITNLTATLIVANMPMNETQALSVLLNFPSVNIDNVIYSITKGASLVSIDENMLTSLNSRGEVTIKAVVTAGGKQLTATETITITDKVRLTNISTDSPIRVGNEVQLSYHYLGNEEITSVEYVIVSGKDKASITEDGILTANKTGTIKVKVVVNGVSSEIITVKIYDISNKLSWWITRAVIICVIVLIFLPSLIITTVKLHKKRKKKQLLASDSTKVKNKE